MGFNSAFKVLTGLEKPLGNVHKEDKEGEVMLTFMSGKWTWL
jgi:hypothetical protein